MCKLSYNTNGLRKTEFLKALLEIKNHGYDGIELSFHDNHIHPLNITEKELAGLKAYCQDNELNVICIATGADNLLSGEQYEPSLIHPEAEGRQRRLNLLRKAIKIAASLKVPVINFASGKLKPEVDPKQAADYLCQEIEQLVNESDDVIFAIEPEPGFFIGTSSSALDLIERVNHPRFQLNLDIGHVYCCEENFFTALEKALPFTRHIHIEDIKNKIHHHQIPGEGDIDFNRVFEIITRSRYSHYISVELYHHAAVWENALTESYRYLSEVMTKFKPVAVD